MIPNFDYPLIRQQREAGASRLADRMRAGEKLRFGSRRSFGAMFTRRSEKGVEPGRA